MKPEELRKHIAMVPQQVNLFSGTIRENLLLADPGAKDAALLEALEEAGLGAFIRSQSKGLDSDVGNAGSSLSGRTAPEDGHCPGRCFPRQSI